MPTCGQVFWSASALEVNAHVHLQLTVILRMASFQSTLLFYFEHVQHYLSDSRAPILIGVIFTYYQFYSSEFKRQSLRSGEVSSK